MVVSTFSLLLNGERAVVVLFVGCVLFSLPLSLLLPGLALSLLALFSLYTEITAENSISLAQFKTRPGASSGILLAAVTLPTLVLAKLIQLSRALALHEFEHEGFDYLTMQYWAASASSFFVLLYLRIVMWCSPDNAFSHPCSPWGMKVGSICTVLCVALFFTPCTRMQTMLNAVWVLLHGLAAVKLWHHLLHTFPSCASIGEALLVTDGLVLYFGDMLACTITKFHEYLTPSEIVSLGHGIKRSEISVIIQGLLLGLLLFPSVFKFVLHILNSFSYRTDCGARAYTERGISLTFFALLGFVMIVFIPSWIQFVLNFHMHPFLWLLTFVFSEPLKRLSLCIYWVCVIYVSVHRFYNISKNSKIERILLRKYYHLMAVLMFLPAVLFQVLWD
uniref:dolichol kinase n=1 Tax=Rhizophora mucronata TaxID=61149 RepID=A0A2P2LD70_RHIMU